MLIPWCFPPEICPKIQWGFPAQGKKRIFFPQVLLIPPLSVLHTSTSISMCLNIWKFSRISLCSRRIFSHCSCSASLCTCFLVCIGIISLVNKNSLFVYWDSKNSFTHSEEENFTWLCVCNCIFYKQLRSLPTAYPSVIHCQSLNFYVIWFYCQLFLDTF